MKGLFLLIIIIFCNSLIPAQDNPDKKFIVLKPDSGYAVGWFWRFWFGDHWRDVWNTDVKVEIINPSKFDGGLRAIKKGGGLQTKSLRFESYNGRIWKFRSLEKNPSIILPPELRESVAEYLLKDQISSSNPFAPIIVSYILSSVDVLESQPQFVYLPDDPALGEYREEFKNQFGTIEIHPDDDEDSFADAEDVKGTYKLLDHLAEDRDEKISAVEYLKARLIDLLIGDWDRHMDQWRWAKFDSLGSKFWYPIPRDRDQAFVKYDGVLPRLATLILPQLTSFDMEYPSVKSLTWNGRFLDRRILTELDKNLWDSVATLIKQKITDSVITSAVSHLPPEVYKISANEIKNKLFNRRDHLTEISNEFYELINETADIFCSGKNEIVYILRENDNNTNVKIFKREGTSLKGKGKRLFQKSFSNSVTNEIRIFLGDGNDAAILTGKCTVSPLIRIIGDNGKDEFIDSSIVSGSVLNFLPVSTSTTRTIFYDSGNETKITLSESSCFDDSDYPDPKTDIEKYEPPIVDRGHKFISYPLIGFNSDYGLILDANAILFSYDFRKIPYSQKHSIDFSFAGRYSKFSLKYLGKINSFPGYKSGFTIEAEATQHFILNYFGYGNNTLYNQESVEKDFYRVDQELINIRPEISLFLSASVKFNTAISFLHSRTEIFYDTLLTGFRYDNYGIGKLNIIGIHPEFVIDFRNNEFFPEHGFFGKFYSAFSSELSDSKNSNSRYGFDARYYQPVASDKKIVLAFRAGGEKISGRYPFFNSAFLGGADNLRGYNKNRFSGDASLFGQMEFRMVLGYFKFIFNNKIGINLFAESGKVFAPDENSDKWHPSYGGGLWISYLQNEIILRTYLAFSKENTIFNFGFGIGY